MAANLVWHRRHMIGTDAAVQSVFIIELHATVHVALPIIVESLLKIFCRTANISKMRKENLILPGKAFDCLSHTHPGSADRPLTQGDPAVIAGHHLHHLLQGVRRNQNTIYTPDHLHRRVVRMDSKADTVPLGMRHHSFQKVFQVLPKPVCRNSPVRCKRCIFHIPMAVSGNGSAAPGGDICSGAEPTDHRHPVIANRADIQCVHYFQQLTKR